MMEGKEELCVCIKFCMNLVKTFAEPFQILQKAFEDERLSYSMRQEWLKRFKEDRTSIADDPRSGRPTVSTDDVHVPK